MMATGRQVTASNDQSRTHPTVLLVRARKPSIVLVETGFSVVSAYVEQFWQSALGPTSNALIGRLARRRLQIGDESARYAPINLAVTRAALGVGRRGMEGKSGPLFKSVDRLARFGFLTIEETALGVPSQITIATHVDTVPGRIRRHWSDELRLRHDVFIQRVLGEEGHGQ